MNTTPLAPLNLKSIARGAAFELFEGALAKVLQNIADPSTDALAAREITLKFRFKPGEDRRSIQVATTSSTKMAGVTEHRSKVYLGKDEAGRHYAFDQDPRQELLFSPPEEPRTLVSFPAQS